MAPFWCFGNIVYLCTDKPVHTGMGKSENIDGILKPGKPFVRPAEGEGVYGRYHSVLSNFAT